MAFGDRYQVFYDSRTKQLSYINVINGFLGVPETPPDNVLDIDDFPVDEANFEFPILEAYDHVLYDPATKAITVKPKVVLIVSPESGTVEANGTDFYTIEFDVKGPDGETKEFTRVKVKDENFIAQVSKDLVEFSEPHVVKVRSFSPGTAKIRVKEEWDGVSSLSNGDSFVRYGRATVELKFKNPTGW